MITPTQIAKLRRLIAESDECVCVDKDELTALLAAIERPGSEEVEAGITMTALAKAQEARQRLLTIAADFSSGVDDAHGVTVALGDLRALAAEQSRPETEPVKLESTQRGLWKAVNYDKVAPADPASMWRHVEMLCRDIDTLISHSASVRREEWERAAKGLDVSAATEEALQQGALDRGEANRATMFGAAAAAFRASAAAIREHGRKG